MFSRALKDYIAVWNAGMGFIYFLISSYLGLLEIERINFTTSLGEDFNKIGAYFGGMSTQDIIIFLFFVAMWLAGVLNILYVRRYFLQFKMKSVVGVLATILLFLVNTAVIVLIFFDVKMDGGNISFANREWLGSLSWPLWVAIGAMCFSGLASLIGIIEMIRGATSGIIIVTEADKIEKKRKEKEEKQHKKEREKEEKKNQTVMPVRKSASREVVDEKNMMFKSGDSSAEDEALAAEIAKNRPNPFLEKKEEVSVAEQPNVQTNANGVPNEVANVNPFIGNPNSALPNISPNISSSADEETPKPEA